MDFPGQEFVQVRDAVHQDYALASSMRYCAIQFLALFVIQHVMHYSALY